MIVIMFYGSSKYNIRNRVNCGIPPKISARYKFCNGGERISVTCQVSANHNSICLKSVFSAYFMHQQMSLEQKTVMSTLFLFIIFLKEQQLLMSSFECMCRFPLTQAEYVFFEVTK